MVLNISGTYTPQTSNIGGLLQAQENNQSNQSTALQSDSLAAQYQQTSFARQEDQVSISAFGVDNTSFLTQAEIVNGINAALGDSGLSVETANPDEFTPEAVANTILGQVEDILSNFAEDEDQAREILGQAREGIEAGIAQAREILDGLSALNEDTDQTINDTEEFIEQGLTAIEESLSSLFDDSTVTEEQAQPQPVGEEQIATTQNAQTAQASSAVADEAQAEDRQRPTF